MIPWTAKAKVWSTNFMENGHGRVPSLSYHRTIRSFIKEIYTPAKRPGENSNRGMSLTIFLREQLKYCNTMKFDNGRG